MRQGEYEAAMAAALFRFTDAWWESIYRIEAVELHAADYHALALEIYGDAYAEYAESLSPMTVAELRAGISEETFYESLERFIFGICPALSYGMRK